MEGSCRVRSNMRFRSIILIALAMSLLASACSASEGESGFPRSTVASHDDTVRAETALVRFDGSSTTLSDYAGSPVVVNFWASWCPSCVAELGAALQPAYEVVGGNIAFLGVNIQDEREAALALVEETGVLFDLAVDPDGDLFLAFGAIGMPFTALVDADGHVVARHNGPLTETQLLDLIAEVFPA